VFEKVVRLRTNILCFDDFGNHAAGVNNKGKARRPPSAVGIYQA
jgi:hypothetical protein